MYFESRADAGRKLAEQLVSRYRYENTILVAINSGGVLVGVEIASELHCLLTMLVSEEIAVPGEGVNFGSVYQGGGYSENRDISDMEMDGYVSEFNGYLGEQRRQAFGRINRLVGDGGTIDKDLLRGRAIIVVSDGFETGSEADAVIEFMKSIKIEKLVIVSPVASIKAVDKLHVLADELHILDVKDNFLHVNHYYDNEEVSSDSEVIDMLKQVILNWR